MVVPRRPTDPVEALARPAELRALSGDPISTPTYTPTLTPTANLADAPSPTAMPTAEPTDTPPPTPADTPAQMPTDMPTQTPTDRPTDAPPDAQEVRLPLRLARIVDEYRLDTSRRFIIVDQDHQTMSLWEPDGTLNVLPISTGDPTLGLATPAWEGKVRYYVGTFHSYGVYADNAWYLFFTNNTILIHGLPYTLEDGVKVYQGREALGHKADSHGCIRVAPEDAQWLTKWDPEGVHLVILPNTLNNGQLAAPEPASPRARLQSAQ
jgi:lipoprotein-anchoring transpeptidase ErfK/SrfK